MCVNVVLNYVIICVLLLKLCEKRIIGCCFGVNGVFVVVLFVLNWVFFGGLICSGVLVGFVVVGYYMVMCNVLLCCVLCRVVFGVCVV